MNKQILIEKYFDGSNFVESNIQSFDNFIQHGLADVITENKEVEPAIIPHNIDSFKIRFGKISVGKPTVIEADGSKRPIFPAEARLRKLSYSAPIFLEVNSYINDIQRESFVAEVGKLPIMVRSSNCNLNGMNRDELVKHGEDPTDPGRYFIINGTEKVLVTIEDLATNNFLCEDLGNGSVVGSLFSAAGSYKIPHQFEMKKDGFFYMSFSRMKSVPVIVVLKALGMLRDEDIMKAVSDEMYDEILLNLLEFTDLKTQEDSLDFLARKSNMVQNKEIRVERAREIVDKFLLPHIGMDRSTRKEKAANICKMLKRFIQVSRGQRAADDKDHYMNKRWRLSGDLLLELFRSNFKILTGDIIYNFQRIIKRGKLPSVKVIIRDSLLTSRLYSAMATGNWVGGRQGVAQRLDRINFLSMISHLQKVNSPLSSSQENFEARALHCTHIGRLCPIETPEGTNIGLRRNMALMCRTSQNIDSKLLREQLVQMGVKEWVMYI